MLLQRHWLLLITADLLFWGLESGAALAGKAQDHSPSRKSGASHLDGNRAAFSLTLPFPPGRDSADSDQRKQEEDFYYTEVQVKEEPAPEVAATTSPISTSAPIIIQQALAKPEALLVEQPVLEPALASSALSQSAPSSFWHIQADHAYQVSWWHLLGMGHLLKSWQRAGHDPGFAASPRCSRDVSLPLPHCHSTLEWLWCQCNSI